MQRLEPGIFLDLALVSCPCHVPLVLALLAGTGAGAVLAAHGPLFVAALALIFLGTLAALLRAPPDTQASTHQLGRSGHGTATNPLHLPR